MFHRTAAIVTLSAFIAASVVNPAFACTGISLNPKDGAFIRGRTMEFGVPLQSKILVLPAGQQLAGTLPDGGKGLNFTTKYSVVGANAFGLTTFVDGINDQGLSLGLLYFPGSAQYADATPGNSARALAPHDFPVWLLGSFATVDEVKEAVKNVVVVPTPTPGLGSTKGAVVPGHFFLRDKNGKSIVVEPVGGTLKVHDAPLGVLTNSPDYDWQMTNLRNYINLSVQDVEKLQLGNVTVPTFGAGSGLRGLPGDFTPPSRFVRAAFFSANATPTNTAKDAVLQAFHILNQFDLPQGSVRNAAVGGVQVEITEWTTVSDMTNLRWYFRTFGDQTIRVVDVKEAIKAAKGNPVQVSMDSEQPIVNFSIAGPAKQ